MHHHFIHNLYSSNKIKDQIKFYKELYQDFTKLSSQKHENEYQMLAYKFVDSMKDLQSQIKTYKNTVKSEIQM